MTTMPRIMHLSLAGFFSLIVVGATACGGDRVAPPSDNHIDVGELRVSPASQQVAVGGTARFAVSGYPSTGAVHWSSGDTTVATVDQTGMATGVRAGAATIIATSNEDPFVKAAAVIIVGLSVGSPVTVSAINTKICTPSAGCTSVPANLASVAGQVDIVLHVDASPRLLTSVQATVTCGSKSVSAQTNMDAIPDASTTSVTLSINTLQVDSTGVRMLPNGPCALIASAVAVSGVKIATNGTQFVLNNTP